MIFDFIISYILARESVNQVVQTSSSLPLPSDATLRGAYAKKSVKLSLLNGEINIAFSYDAKLIETIKTLPKRKVFFFVFIG